MKNSELKNKLIIILFALAGLSSHAQICVFTQDSINVSKIDYINSDSIAFGRDFDVTFICNSREGIFYYKIYKEKSSFFIQYGDAHKSLVTLKIKGKVTFFETPNFFKGKYYLQSENFSKEYFDMLVIKSKNDYSQIIPIGSTIYGNEDCLKKFDQSIGLFLVEFRDIYKKYYKKMKKKQSFILPLNI